MSVWTDQSGKTSLNRSDRTVHPGHWTGLPGQVSLDRSVGTTGTGQVSWDRSADRSAWAGPMLQDSKDSQPWLVLCQVRLDWSCCLVSLNRATWIDHSGKISPGQVGRDRSAGTDQPEKLSHYMSARTGQHSGQFSLGRSAARTVQPSALTGQPDR